MIAFLLLIGLVLLLVAAPLLPLALAAWCGVLLLSPVGNERSLLRNALLGVALIGCLSPYLYIYGRQFYRNHLCEKEGVAEVTFDLAAWIHQHPGGAVSLVAGSGREQRKRIGEDMYTEQLNSRFSAEESFIKRELSVTESRLQIRDLEEDRVVARSTSFSLPIGSGMNLISFEIAYPAHCGATAQYYKLKESLRSVGIKIPTN